MNLVEILLSTIMLYETNVGWRWLGRWSGYLQIRCWWMKYGKLSTGEKIKRWYINGDNLTSVFFTLLDQCTTCVLSVKLVRSTFKDELTSKWHKHEALSLFQSSKKVVFCFFWKDDDLDFIEGGRGSLTICSFKADTVLLALVVTLSKLIMAIIIWFILHCRENKSLFYWWYAITISEMD